MVLRSRDCRKVLEDTGLPTQPGYSTLTTATGYFVVHGGVSGLPQLEECLLSEPRDCRGYGQEEGDGAHPGVQGDQGGAELGSGVTAAQQEEETEEPDKELEDEQDADNSRS